MNVTLVMFRESGERRDFVLKNPETFIGRKEECDIRIPLAEVSRRHASVVVTDDSVILRDHKSANGTYLNNERIKEKELNAGDHLVVGPVVFTVQIDGVPEDVRAVRTKLRPLSTVGNAASASDDSGAADHVYDREEDVDPISALEALASSADQTAIDPFEDDEGPV